MFKLNDNESMLLELENKIIDMPYTSNANLMSIKKWANCVKEIECDALSLSVTKNGVTYAICKFFVIKNSGRIHLVSGGRFGFSGVFIINEDITINHIVDLLIDYCKNKKISTLSVFINTPNISYSTTNFDLKIKEIVYLMASVKESCDENGLSFRNAKKRSNLSRSLKSAKEKPFSVGVIGKNGNMQILNEWYLTCHKKRIEEISGREWEEEIFADLISNGTGNLVYVYNAIDKKILGGCFILNSETILELFMMSTPRANQEEGVNFLLTEYLYKYAFMNNNKFVNWQSSNPPVGPLVNYKKSWNANEYKHLLINYKLDQSFSFNDQYIGFRDFFIFPYE
jgi:hypothetical protein